MAIATKNGRVILTPLGSAAEACQCCKKPCGSQSNSGGAGVTVENYDFPEEEGDVQFTYQAFSVRDRFTVYGGSQTFFDTGGPVFGGQTVSFYKPQGVTTISVRVEGPIKTGWNYTIGCPQVGACCNGTTCSIKPQSQCNAAAGEVFKGFGTVCSPNPCLICKCNLSGIDVPQSFLLSTSNIEYYLVSQTGFLDMSGAESLLSTLASSRQVTASLNQGLSRQNLAVYRTPLSSDECFSASAELILRCGEKIVSGVLSFGVGRFCQDASVNGGAGCALAAYFNLSASAFNYCQNPQPSTPITYSNFYNSEQAGGAWRCGFVGPNPSSIGSYYVSSGDVTIMPVYANPLP